MAERLPTNLEDELAQRLRFYEDLGIELFYRDRTTRCGGQLSSADAAVPQPTTHREEPLLPKPIARTANASVSNRQPLDTGATYTAKGDGAKIEPFLPTASPSLFSANGKAAPETLSAIRADLGECTRCKLHTGRTKLVFGHGNPRAELVFIGEGPGRDEDLQGLPFVGRAGKLLTQMIEAMGLQRTDVYICNVVKCRPPENRTPEKDEVAECSPFLLRQLDAIAPKVMVCLGSTAFQALLQTNRGISSFRGEWLEFHGRKLMATYHPAYLLRNPAAKADVWKDLQKVMAVLGLTAKKGKPS